MWSLKTTNWFYNISEKLSPESKNWASDSAITRYVTASPARFQSFERIFPKIRKR
jgi:hypothetical protein